MPFHNTINSYGSVTKWLHWFVAILVVGMLCLGTTMSQLDSSPLKSTLIMIHKSFGLLLFITIIVRWLWRVSNIKPKPINIKNPMLNKLLPWYHETLYLVVFLMPVSGILMNAFKHYTLPFFGLFVIKTTAFPENIFLHHFFGNMHSVMAWVVTIMLVIHIGAAIKHHFYNKDNTLKRMLPSKPQNP